MRSACGRPGPVAITWAEVKRYLLAEPAAPGTTRTCSSQKQSSSPCQLHFQIVHTIRLGPIDFQMLELQVGLYAYVTSEDLVSHCLACTAADSAAWDSCEAMEGAATGQSTSKGFEHNNSPGRLGLPFSVRLYLNCKEHWKLLSQPPSLLFLTPSLPRTCRGGRDYDPGPQKWHARVCLLDN